MAVKTIAVNRKAYHDYFIEDTVEAGLVLTGTEIATLAAMDSAPTAPGSLRVE